MIINFIKFNQYYKKININILLIFLYFSETIIIKCSFSLVVHVNHPPLVHLHHPVMFRLGGVL